MKLNLTIGISIISLFAIFQLAPTLTAPILSPTDSVEDILISLGNKPMPHSPISNMKNVSIKNGKNLFYKGYTNSKIKPKLSKQSRHFECSSCHLTVKERFNLTDTIAQSRLDYCIENDLPMLPGSSLFGVVNRKTYYMDDYDRKYGELVKPAQNDLRNSIQLCATECAQGRKLKPFELESILLFFWSLELTINDLNLNDIEKTQIESALQKNENQEETIALIKSKYLEGIPAHFIKPPKDRKAGYNIDHIADPENGKKIYENSCLYCHKDRKHAYFNLDHTVQSKRFLNKHFQSYNRYSTYQVVRYGTSPIPGKKAYMPLYTFEKMDNKMVEDLRAYLQQYQK